MQAMECNSRKISFVFSIKKWLFNDNVQTFQESHTMKYGMKVKINPILEAMSQCDCFI